jgi:hypothetical protein
MGATPSDYSLFRYDESFPGEPIIRMSFFDELKRRNVVRVGIAHAAIGWVLAQLAGFLARRAVWVIHDTSRPGRGLA